MKPGTNLLALASVGLAVASFVLGLLITNGIFTGGGRGSCGEYGLRCLGYGIAMLGAGCLAGAICAIVALTHAASRGWLAWLGLLLNALPLIAIGVGSVLIAMR